MKCEYGNCNRSAKYFMGWKGNGNKKFGMVCAMHDKILGRTNLITLTHMTINEAVQFDTDCKKTVE